MKNMCIILILVLISSPVLAEMYQWVDEHGIKHFSNSPSLITGQDVTVQTEIKTGATQRQEQKQQQRIDDRQPFDDLSDIEKELRDQRKIFRPVRLKSHAII